MAFHMQWKKVFLQDLGYIVREIKENIEKPALIILTGAMGAGKTAFVKEFTEVEGEGISPTYSVVNEMGDIAHADFYRVESVDEVVHLELPLYLEGKNYFLVEWGKKWAPFIIKEVPPEFIAYEIEITINNLEESATSSRDFHLRKL